MYAMIENLGVADVRAFTKLGLSTARGESDKIGQFGSGAKHGILTLMRDGLNPVIYCGTEKVTFYSQPNSMNGKAYNDMFVKVGSKAAVELSFCLEFGAIDWTDVSMGLRELVSNAIDNCEGSIDHVSVKIVENPRAKSGYTRVFVPLTPQVQQFVNNLSKMFLHFVGDASKTFIDKMEPGKARIYRKGVFVRVMDSWNEDSVYNYNLGESLKIDECRNSNDWDCKARIGEVISTDKIMIREMFTDFVNGKLGMFEHRLSEYVLKGQDWWKEIWTEVAGKNAVIMGVSSTMAEFIQKKGKTPIAVPSGWYDAMEKAGIPTGMSCLSKLENKGFNVIPATSIAIGIVNKVWDWLSELELTNGKSKPAVSCFSRVIESTDKGTVFGYYEDNTVFINRDFHENVQTYVEELAHHITGAADGTREFQEFAFQIATRMGELIFS